MRAHLNEASPRRHARARQAIPSPLLPRRFGGLGWAPVHRAQIRGEWWVTKDLIWPAVVWNEARCWAYLHDLTPDTLQWVMTCLRQAELDRQPPGIIRWEA